MDPPSSLKFRPFPYIPQKDYKPKRAVLFFRFYLKNPLYATSTYFSEDVLEGLEDEIRLKIRGRRRTK